MRDVSSHSLSTTLERPFLNFANYTQPVWFQPAGTMQKPSFLLNGFVSNFEPSPCPCRCVKRAQAKVRDMIQKDDFLSEQEDLTVWSLGAILHFRSMEMDLQRDAIAVWTKHCQLCLRKRNENNRSHCKDHPAGAARS